MRKFIHGFSSICKPLHVLTQKDQKFLWNDECQPAFEKPKETLITAPVLGFSPRSLKGRSPPMRTHPTMRWVVFCFRSKIGKKELLAITVSVSTKPKGDTVQHVKNCWPRFVQSSIFTTIYMADILKYEVIMEASGGL